MKLRRPRPGEGAPLWPPQGRGQVRGVIREQRADGRELRSRTPDTGAGGDDSERGTAWSALRRSYRHQERLTLELPRAQAPAHHGLHSIM